MKEVMNFTEFNLFTDKTLHLGEDCYRPKEILLIPKGDTYFSIQILSFPTPHDGGFNYEVQVLNQIKIMSRLKQSIGWVLWFEFDVHVYEKEFEETVND